MELRHNNALGTVYNEGSAGRHVGYGSEVHILNNGIEVLVLGIGAVELELGLKKKKKSKPSIKAFLNGVAGWINKVV